MNLKESLKKVKENYCYISEDYNSEVNGNCNQSEIELSDRVRLKLVKTNFNLVNVYLILKNLVIIVILYKNNLWKLLN